MILESFYLGCLSHASYLIGDERTKKAVVVDPQRDVDVYLKAARKHGLKIVHVVLTHFHADFVAGHLELKRLTGATIHLGSKAKASYPFSRLKEGTTIELGSVRLRALETPGHTPEGVSLLVFDLAKDAERPRAVLTGDTLFIGDVGRPDLMASSGVTAATLAGQLYDSLHKKLLKLPDATLVYPAHGAGSLCGKNLSSETVSTIGQQRRYNPALKPMPKARFVKLVCDQPEAPAYFAHDARLNKQKRGTLEDALKKGLKPLAFSSVLRKQKAGAQVLDTRDASAFAAGHLRGSVNVGLGGRFASFAGMALDPAAPLVLICDKGREKESFLRLARVGLEGGVAGYLQGGLGSVPPQHVGRMARLSPRQLGERLDSMFPPAVLDVRTPAERADSFIPGSVHIPLQQLPRRLKDAPKASELVVYCAGGYRSAIAASLLMAAGRTGISDLEGGMAAWQEKAKEHLPGRCSSRDATSSGR